jgi:ABC-2 family transporter protein
MIRARRSAREGGNDMRRITAGARLTGPLLVRRFLAGYARNPVNLLMLVLVPVAFVAAAAGSMAELARLLSGAAAPGAAVQTVTAGWAAAFIAAIAMYFQVRTARAADRRLVLAGLPAGRLAAARAVTGLALAVVASAAALVTLAARGGIEHPGRVLAGTFMFAVIYLAIGALVGALVASPVNGTVVIFFAWITDVMFGPVFGSPTRPAGRMFPTHFLTLWMTDLPSHHAGRVGDLGWALIWTLGAAILAWAVLTSASRAARAPRRRHPGTAGDQLHAAIRAGLLDWGRNRVLWVLLAAVPAVFIVLATALAPGSRVRLTVEENGRQVSKVVNLAFGAGIHPAFMAPMAIASLATLAGMFIILDSRAADQRLVLAGGRAGPLLASRLALIALAGLLATGVSLAVAATVADVQQWGSYIAASALLALTYAMIGVIIAPLFGQVAGVLVAFLVPFLDLGIAQDPMLHAAPPAWAHFLPGYGGFRVLTSAVLTHGFNQAVPLLIALAWLAGATGAAAVLFHRNMRTAQGASRRGPRARRPRPAPAKGGLSLPGIAG